MKEFFDKLALTRCVLHIKQSIKRTEENAAKPRRGDEQEGGDGTPSANCEEYTHKLYETELRSSSFKIEYKRKNITLSKLKWNLKEKNILYSIR